MKPEKTSSVVFAGKLHSVFLDERELFDGQVDTTIRKTDLLLQCTFAEGRHELLFDPNKVSVTTFSDTIMPGELIEAATLIAGKMEALSSIIKILGVGFNHTEIIRRNGIGKRGIDICGTLITDELSRIVGKEEIFPLCAAEYDMGGFRYKVRIEPFIESEGDDLFFNANGHQDVTSRDSLLDKLQRIDEFAGYMQGLLNRLKGRAS